VTGLVGRRRLFPGGGEILEVAVREPFPVAVPHRPAPAGLSFAEGWVPPEPEPLPPPPEPLSLREFEGREQGKRFGEKVHRLLEAAPPAGDPWPPRGFSADSIVSWSDGEEVRWKAVRKAIAASPFRKELCRAVVVGTEFPLLRCRGGWAEEDRADLVVVAPRGAGHGEVPDAGQAADTGTGAAAGGAGEGRRGYWIVDYKTGRREKETEELYVRQVRGYMEILAGAWGAPVRGFIWYVETGAVVEVTGPA
jgi:hypothetical protein